jgi:branched-chain amino acid transport system substrate-binding protein
MKKQSIKSIVMKIAVVGLLVLGIANPGLTVEPPKEVKVGVIAPLTGPLADYGIKIQRGVTLAVERINRDGGIKSLNGAKIRLVFGDDEGKPDVSMSEAERLIKVEKVDALLGPYSSATAFPVTQVAEKNEIPIILPTTGKDEITERGFKYTFRLCAKSSEYSKTMVDFLGWLSEKTKIPIKTVALLYEDGAVGQSYFKPVKEKFLPKTSYKLLADLPYPTQTKDIRSTILRLKGVNPDVVLTISYVLDAILITRTMHELQFDCKAVITGGAGNIISAYYNGVGTLSDYLFAIDMYTLSLPSGEVKERVKEFEDRFKDPPDMLNLYWYTGTYILANAINDAGSVNKEKVRDALGKVHIKVGEKGNLLPFPAEFDKSGQAPATILMIQWLKGKKEVVFPESLATMKPIFPIPKWAERK